jgi:hypothetical protein
LDEESQEAAEPAAKKPKRRLLRRKVDIAKAGKITELEAQAKRKRVSLAAAWFAFLIALLTATMPMLPELVRMLFEKLKP